jgi:PAS domain S-box-containing protein
MQNMKVLIVEDELVTVELIRDVLSGHGYNIVGSAAEGKEALELIERGKPDIILMDIKIKGDMDGIDLARIVEERFSVPVIYLTAFADKMTVERAKMTESYGYLIKPFGEMELLTNIEIALHKHQLDRKLKESEKRYRTLFETMSESVYIHDGKGAFIDFNPAMESLTGYTRRELLALNIGELFLDTEALRHMNEALAKAGLVKDVPAAFRRKDGGRVQCIISASRAVGAGRSKETVRGVVRDVTEQWEAQQKLEEERAFTDAVIDSLPAMIFAIDKDGRFMRWNKRLMDLSGLSGSMMQGVSMFDLLSADNGALFRLKLDEGFARGEVTVEAPLHLRGQGGELRDYVVTARKLGIEGKEYMVGAGVDITDRRVIEEALRLSKETYRMLVENINDVIYTLDSTGVITYISPVLERISHYRVEELIGSNFKDLVHADDLPKLLESFMRTLSGAIESSEFRMLDRDGSVHNVRTSSRINYENGVVTGLTGLITDITERKRMEEALVESENRYRAIFDGSMNLVYIHDFQGRFIDANDAALTLLGYSREEIPSLSFVDLVSEEELKIGMDVIGNLFTTGGQSTAVDFNLKTKSGDYRCVETSASLLYREGKPSAILGVARDITEQKKYIDELKNVHAENTNLLNSIASILIGVDTNDVITHWNHMAELTFRIPAGEALGRKITGYDINWEWDNIYAGISSCIIDSCPVNLSDISYTDKNGRKGVLGITINPIMDESNVLRGFLIYGKDITEKRMVEQQLLQAGKMATVGEMATGVAHELNQPLNVIKMAAQYLMDGLNEKYATEDFIRERVGKIVVQVDRAAHIINHLREFGRKSDYDFGIIDPNLPIRVAFDMLGEQLRVNDIAVRMDLAEGLPTIRGDIHKLEQVFIYLIVNAKDALLSMKKSLQEKNIMVKSLRAPESGDVLIRFSDTGPGIPADIIERIFEPFFTTKEVGKGTGLGLSISYGIIKAHQGAISALSEGDGTVFTISLPASSEEKSETGGED